MTWGFAGIFHWEAVGLACLGFQFCGGRVVARPGWLMIGRCRGVSTAQAGTPTVNYPGQLPGGSSSWKPSGRLARESEGFVGNCRFPGQAGSRSWLTCGFPESGHCVAVASTWLRCQSCRATAGSVQGQAYRRPAGRSPSSCRSTASPSWELPVHPGNLQLELSGLHTGDERFPLARREDQH
jgi:hypothetical protein